MGTGLWSLVLAALVPTIGLAACSPAAAPSPTPAQALTGWKGTIDSDTFRVYTSNQGARVNRCQTSWHSDLSFTVTGGKVAGQGTSTLVGEASCSPIATGIASTQLHSETFAIGGTHQRQAFHLVLHHLSGGGGQAETGGEVLLYSLMPCQAQFAARELVIPIQAPDAAAGPADADVTLTCGGGAADQFSNHSRVSLRLIKP
jgi:hypothetical protein